MVFIFQGSHFFYIFGGEKRLFLFKNTIKSEHLNVFLVHLDYFIFEIFMFDFLLLTF